MHINFKELGIYSRMIEETGEEECKVSIEEYIKVNNVSSIFRYPFKKIIYTSENIQKYLDAYLFLDIQSIQPFVDHIIKEYILDKCILLENVYHYDIIQLSIENITKSGSDCLNNENILYIQTYIPITHLVTNESMTDDVICKLTDLVSLSAPGLCNIISGTSFKNLTKLKYLDISSNQYVCDKYIENMTQLVSLCCSYKSIITDRSVCKLINLTHLDAHLNAMVTDESVCKLTNLISLNANNNHRITDLSVKTLKNLTTLEMSNKTNITRISLSPKLTTLNISGTNITNDDIRNMTQLTSLDISGISFITDDGLYNLTNLIKLNCSWNRGITDKSVSLLTKLEILDASATDLTDESICKLTKLTRLNASYSNKITDKSIITLKNLKEIKSYKNYAIKSINNRCGIKWNK